MNEIEDLNVEAEGLLTPVAEEAAEPEVAPGKLPSLLQNRDYMLLWSGQVVSRLAAVCRGSSPAADPRPDE